MNREIQQRNKGNNEITKRTKNSRQKNKDKRLHTKQRKKWSRAPFFLTGQKIARNKSADLKI